MLVFDAVSTTFGVRLDLFQNMTAVSSCGRCMCTHTERTRRRVKVESFVREVASYLARKNAQGCLQATEQCPIQWNPALQTPLKYGHPL